MSFKNALITDFVHPDLLLGLDALGYHTTYAPGMSRSEMEEALPQFVGVVINTRCAIDRQAMEASKNLRWIARLGSGLDIIDLDAAAHLEIAVISAPEGNAQAVAEHAAGMLLSLANKLIPADQSVREGLWLREQNRGWEISGKTIGIIGFGNNGSAFSRLWQGWNVRILAHDKYLAHYGNEFVEEKDLDELLGQSDIISLHIPLTQETTGMVNTHFISRCKKGAVLINTSRGKVLDLRDVRAALQDGQLSGVCLDVLAYEPPVSGPEDFQSDFREICKLENVVLSPHIAGWTVESKRKIAQILLEKIRTWSFTSNGLSQV